MAETFRMEEQIPFAGVLSGPTSGDNVRHLVAREALLDRLYDWRPTLEFFDRVNARTGVGPASRIAAAAIDDLATVTGFANRREVWAALREPVFTAPVGDVNTPEIHPVGQRMMGAMQEFANRSFGWSEDVRTSVDVYLLARDFVIGHGMPWPWMAMELLFEASTRAYGFVYQVRLERHRLVEVPEPAGNTDVEFTVPEGIPLAEAVSRLKSEQTRLEAMLEAARPLPRGRMPKEQVPKIQRNAGWYFEVCVRKDPILAVARRNFPPPEVAITRRRDIKQGLDSVRSYFEMTPYHFTPRGVIARKDGYPMGKEDIGG